MLMVVGTWIAAECVLDFGDGGVLEERGSVGMPIEHVMRLVFHYERAEGDTPVCVTQWRFGWDVMEPDSGGLRVSSKVLGFGFQKGQVDFFFVDVRETGKDDCFFFGF
jgi:hypothetical protein